MQKFIIVAQFRTGSTLLMESLKPHCLHEIFQHVEYTRINKQLAAQRNQKPIEYLNFHLSRGNQNIIGAKIMFPQLAREGLSKIISNDDYKVILVYRKNLTDMYLSYKWAHMTKQWAVFKDNQRNMPKSQVSIDIDDLISLSEKTIDNIQYVKDTVPSERLEIVRYNQLINEDNLINIDTINRARKFLGLPILSNWIPNMLKQANPERYKKWLSNYDEVVERVGETYGIPFSRETPSVWEK